MIVVSEEVFACWSKSCAPPPAGKGGSNKGGPWSNRQKLAKHGKGKYTDPQSKGRGKDHYNKPLEEQERIERAERRALGKAAVRKWDKQTRHGKNRSLKNEPMVKAKTKYDDYVSRFKSGK